MLQPITMLGCSDVDEMLMVTIGLRVHFSYLNQNKPTPGNANQVAHSLLIS